MGYLCGAAKYYNRIPKPNSKAQKAKAEREKLFLNERIVCCECGNGDATLHVKDGQRICGDCLKKN